MFLVVTYDREITVKRNQTQAIATGMTENNHPAPRPNYRAWQESTSPPNATPPSQPPDLDALRQQIDWEHLHRISDDSAEFEWELLQVFAEDSIAYLAHLKQAIAQEDFWQIERDAHHIKGASANVGATSIQTAAAALEQQARAKRLEDSDRWIAMLENAIDQLILLVKLAPG